MWSLYRLKTARRTLPTRSSSRTSATISAADRFSMRASSFSDLLSVSGKSNHRDGRVVAGQTSTFSSPSPDRSSVMWDVRFLPWRSRGASVAALHLSIGLWQV